MKKIEKLRRNIMINSSASLILLMILGGISFYVFNISSDSKKESQEIENSTNQIKSKMLEINRTIEDVKKYKKIWQEIDENKKSTNAIKIDDINKFLKDSSDRYNISKTNIQVILPTELNSGIFSRKTLKTLYATGSLSFEALDDTKTISFTKDFFNKLPGYIIITSFKMNKNKIYNQQDLVKISTGVDSGAIQVDIKFSWFTYKEK